MSVDYAAAIWVGVPRSEFVAAGMESLIEDDVVSVCPPHYDGWGEGYAIVGFSIAISPDYSPEEINIDTAQIESKKAAFKELTGLDAKLYLSPYGM